MKGFEAELFPSKLEEDVVRYLNLARSDPAAIIEILTKTGALLDQAREESESDKSGEVDEIFETIQHMSKHKTVVQLEYMRSLQAAARSQAAQILNTGELTHIGENYEAMAERLRRFVGSKGSFAECFVVGHSIAETIVLSLLIDFGLLDKPNREIALNNSFKSVGVCFVPDFKGAPLCVLSFFGDSKSKLTAVFPDNPLDEQPWWANEARGLSGAQKGAVRAQGGSAGVLSGGLHLQVRTGNPQTAGGNQPLVTSFPFCRSIWWGPFFCRWAPRFPPSSSAARKSFRGTSAASRTCRRPVAF